MRIVAAFLLALFTSYASAQSFGSFIGDVERDMGSERDVQFSHRSIAISGARVQVANSYAP